MILLGFCLVSHGKQADVRELWKEFGKTRLRRPQHRRYLGRSASLFGIAWKVSVAIFVVRVFWSSVEEGKWCEKSQATARQSNCRLEALMHSRVSHDSFRKKTSTSTPPERSSLGAHQALFFLVFLDFGWV